MITLNFVFINISYLIVAAGLMVKDILWLRSMLVVAELAMISFGILADMNSIAIWNSVFLAINLVQIVRLSRERRPIEIPEKLKEIYLKIFSEMTSREFLSFWHTGKDLSARNTTIIMQDEIPKELFFILTGKVKIACCQGTVSLPLSKNQMVAILGHFT